MMDLIKFLFLLTFFVNELHGIIRNDITNRCLHLRLIEKMRDSKKLPVSARGCTWDSPAHKTRSRSSEHVEIIPVSEGRFLIRRVHELDNSTSSNQNKDKREKILSTCLISRNNEPSLTSLCTERYTDSDALFSIDQVPQRNFKGYITSTVSFKIRNRLGYCLTVRPGFETLSFKECSSKHGLFQVWSVCRHTPHCDVDLTWTPRKIHFPVNKTDNHTTEMEKNIVGGNVNGIRPIGNAITSSNVSNPGIINEVLYTIQNALKIYEGSERFLVPSLESFYPNEVLAEAVSVTERLCLNLKCTTCAEWVRASSSKMDPAGYLLKWMTDCNSPPKIQFLSKDVLHVLLHLFPIHESFPFLRELPVDEYKISTIIIPSLRRYLSELEERVNPSQQKFANQEISPNEKETTEEMPWNLPDSESNENEDSQYKVPILLDIDIRSGKPTNKTNVRIQKMEK